MNQKNSTDLKTLQLQQQQQQHQQEIQNCLATLRKSRDLNRKFIPPRPPSPDLILPPASLENESFIRARNRAAAIAAAARQRQYEVAAHREQHPDDKPLPAMNDPDEEPKREEDDRKAEQERRKAREEHWRFCRWQQERLRRRGGTLSPNSARLLGRGQRRPGGGQQQQSEKNVLAPSRILTSRGAAAEGSANAHDGGGIEPHPPSSSDTALPDVPDDFTPSFAPHFVERLLHEDVRKHLEASNLRVAFCRNGGSWFDESLGKICHEPQYLKVTAGGAQTAREPASKSPRIPAFSGLPSAPPVVGSEVFLTEAATQAQKRRGSRKGLSDVDPWTTIVSLHDLREVDSIEKCIARMQHTTLRGSRAEERYARLIPDNTLQYTLISELISASNEDFRKMVEYRPQDTEARQRESAKSHTKLKASAQRFAHSEEVEASPGVRQHVRFRQLLRVEANQLFRRGAEEIERWNDDRERMHNMKFESMSLDAMGGGWARTISRIREAISSSLEGEFAAERRNLQDEFFARFSTAIKEKLRKAFVQLTPEGERLLQKICAAFHGDLPFGGNEMQKIVEEVDINAFILTDVTSILYSLGGALGIAQQFWLNVIKRKTEFLDPNAKMKAKMNLLDEIDHRSARWILRLAPSQVGPGLIQWAMSTHVAHTLRGDERERFLTMLPLPQFAMALIRTNPLAIHPEVLRYFIRVSEHRVNQMRELRDADPLLHDKFVDWLKRSQRVRALPT